MIILDTDALGHLQKKDPVGVLIESGLGAYPDRDVRITAVSAYEMMSGAVAPIDRRKKERRDPIQGFQLLRDLVDYLARWRGLILPYEAASERNYRGFPARLRQELKDDAWIAAVAPAYGAAAWTCNGSDFAKVPGLIVFRDETASRIR